MMCTMLLINFFFKVRIMWDEDEMSIYLCPWHVLKVWCLLSMEKNQGQWEVSGGIGWPSCHHVCANWIGWKHWCYQISWEKQNHWKFHTTLANDFDTIFLSILLPIWCIIYNLHKDIKLFFCIALICILHFPFFALESKQFFLIWMSCACNFP